jgi:hypothetical protein
MRFFGRRNTQIIGFIALAILYFVIGISFKQLEELPELFIVLYPLQDPTLYSNSADTD